MSKIQEILKQWKEDSKADGVLQFKYSYLDGTLWLYTHYCGYYIGRAGTLVDKYRAILQKEIVGFTELKFTETDYYYIA